LDPAGAVDAGDRRSVGVEHPAPLVRDGARALVERDALDRCPAVPDAPEDDAAGDNLVLVRRDRASVDELVADDLDRLDLLLPEDRHRRRVEALADRAGPPRPP